MPEKLINTIPHFLSKTWISWVVLIWAMLARMIQLVYFFNIRLDASYQNIATKNLVAGHGISLDKVLPSDLSQTIYEPLINWPPGYSLLLAPFYILFGGDYISAGLTLGIIGALVLIIATRGILRLLDVPQWGINLYTLLAGFYIYYFYLIASSDAITISFFSVALYYMLLLIKQPGKWLKSSIAIAICLCLCGALKYLFIPVTLIIPAYLILVGYADRRTDLRKAGMLSLSILIIVIGGMLAYQKMLSGQVGYISEPGRGFYPEHLTDAYPFIPSSFLRGETLDLFIPGSSGYLLRLLQVIHVVLLLIAAFYILKRLASKKWKNLSAEAGFFYTGFFISVAITLVLALLSIQVQKESWEGGHLWTYLEEQRYYGLPMIMVHLGFFIGYRYCRQFNWIKYLFVLLLVLLAVETVRGFVFTANRVMKVGKEEYSWQFEKRIQVYADQLIQKEKAGQVDLPVVVSGSSFYYNHRICLYSNTPLLSDPALLNQFDTLRTSKQVLLLVVLHERDLTAYSSFLSRFEKQLAGQFSALYFYTVYVNPK